MKKIVASCPYFLVRNVVESAAYYRDKLGYSIPEYWGDPPNFVMPQRDSFVVMLDQVNRLQPNPNGANGVWDAYFWCTGVDELFLEFESAGADIVSAPTNRDHYGMREIAVRDLDGYQLVFAENAEN